jgi:hypothetical protein
VKQGEKRDFCQSQSRASRSTRLRCTVVTFKCSIFDVCLDVLFNVKFEFVCLQIADLAASVENKDFTPVNENKSKKESSSVRRNTSFNLNISIS